MTYAEAVEWINNLNDQRLAGYDNWRLPGGETHPDDDPQGSTLDNVYYYSCNGSEFGHLFYDELGGTAGKHINKMWDDNLPPNEVDNDDPDLALFVNIPDPGLPGYPYIYWTEMMKDSTHAWTFNIDNGSYTAVDISKNYRLRAWAVRDTDGDNVMDGRPYGWWREWKWVAILAPAILVLTGILYYMSRRFPRE